ncbi:hypothetical protein M2323_001584 [Rhodoblastus acidophilus]|nr:hypothetical protein [Rhodoblastus acidophilus]
MRIANHYAYVLKLGKYYYTTAENPQQASRPAFPSAMDAGSRAGSKDGRRHPR